MEGLFQRSLPNSSALVLEYARPARTNFRTHDTLQSRNWREGGRMNCQGYGIIRTYHTVEYDTSYYTVIHRNYLSI